MLGEQRVMEQLVGLGPEGDELDEAYEHYWRNRSASARSASNAPSRHWSCSNRVMQRRFGKFVD